MNFLITNIFNSNKKLKYIKNKTMYNYKFTGIFGKIKYLIHLISNSNISIVPYIIWNIFFRKIAKISNSIYQNIFLIVNYVKFY